MSDPNPRKPLLRWSDLWSFPLTFIAVVAAEYLWNWAFEDAAYVDWGEAFRLTIFVIVFVKVGELIRNRK
jgi:hypothetical protein